MREFPEEYESGKAIEVYPERADPSGADVLEIGPGRGDLLFTLAEQMPEKRFVAVELGRKRFNKLISRMEDRRLKNITLLCGDARFAIRNGMQSARLEKIFVLFPDPWPKRRHAPKRLMKAEFMAELARMLRPGGDLFFATDVEWYAQWVLKSAQAVQDLRNMGEPFVGPEDIFSYFPTFFEEKWRSRGRQIHYLHFSKEPSAG